MRETASIDVSRLIAGTTVLIVYVPEGHQDPVKRHYDKSSLIMTVTVVLNVYDQERHQDLVRQH